MIAGLTQWVKDQALPWLWHRPAAAGLIRLLAWELPYATGEALNRKKKKNLLFSVTQLMAFFYSSLWTLKYHLTPPPFFFFFILQTQFNHHGTLSTNYMTISSTFAENIPITLYCPSIIYYFILIHMIFHFIFLSNCCNTLISLSVKIFAVFLSSLYPNTCIMTVIVCILSNNCQIEI